MKFLKNIFLLLLLLIVVGAIYLATLKGDYDIARSRTIDANRLVVFNELNDLKNWKEWGPWYEQDSTIRVQYEANTIGEGGAYSWTSDVEGGGRMKTLSAEKAEFLKQELVFETPFGDMKSEVYWLLKDSEDGGTHLTWGISGELPFFSRFMASGMEDQLGPMEERGLELLDETIQRKLKVYSIDSIGVVDFSGGFYLYESTSSKIGGMNSKFEGMLERLEQFVKDHNVRLTGSPFTIYHKFDLENGTTMFSVAVPIADRIVSKDSDVLTGFLERGTYFKTVLKGAYVNSQEAWEKARFNATNLEGYELVQTGEPFEIYVNDMQDTPNPADLITEIYLPIRKR